jgi:hypothetical protein
MWTLEMQTQTRQQTDNRPKRVRTNHEPRTTAKQRSAVSNGRRLFVAGDGRSPWSRRYYDLIAMHVSDLGGRSNLSEAQVALIKRAATLECELELMEGRLSQGEQVDLDVFGRATGNLRRVWESLGLKREAKDITNDVDQAQLRRVLEYAEQAEEAS